MGRHKEWRKEAKKQRRKKIRQKSAKERQKELLNAESNPCAQAWLKEQEDADEAIRTEEMLQSEKNNLKWMQEELRAQQEFKVKRLERKKQDEEIARQKAELLKEIQEREEKKRQKEQEEKERLEMQEEAIRLREQKIEDFLQKGCELPDEVRVSIESNPLQPTCPFFQKVAACRFNDACSRNHIRPSISCTVLIPSMFTHPSLVSPMGSQAGDQECTLEYTDTEIQNDYNEFFEDVCSEVEKLGRVIRFLTCCNFEPHLRGNVYVQLQNERDALRVCRNLSGRWFGGRRLQPLFVDISNWRNAVCGLFRYGRCPKGRSCNFLHIFVNPKRLFMNSPVRRASTASSSNSWSPERESSRASSSKSHRSHSRRSNRSRSRSPHQSSRSSRQRSRRRSPDENLKRKSRERSLSPWSPGRRLTTDTPPRKELSDSTNTP